MFLIIVLIILKYVNFRLDLASLNDHQHPRLEITELSDEELPIDDDYEDDHDQDAFHRHSRSNTDNNERHAGGNKIFEIASGLY